MQVWNMVYAARWKYRMHKIAKKSPFGHRRTTLSGCIFATKACIDNRKKNLLNSNISSTCPHSMDGSLPSNRHHWSNDDCLEGKREKYQVCAVQYCVQQLCTVQCTHIWTYLSFLRIWFSPLLDCRAVTLRIGERKTWRTQSEFCTWQNYITKQQPPKMYI